MPEFGWIMSGFFRRLILACSLQCLACLTSLFGATQPFLDEQFLHKNLRASSQAEANWFKVRGSTAATVTAAEESGAGRGVGRLRIAAQGFFPGVVGTFSSAEAPERRIALENKGDQVTLFVEFRFLRENGTNSEIRVGLYNYGNSPVTQDGTTNSNTHFGYRFDLPQSGGYGLLMKETGLSAGLATGDDQHPFGGGLLKSLPALGHENHRLTLTFLKQSEGVMVTAVVDGQIVQQGVDGGSIPKKLKSPGVYTSFDEVFIGIKNQGSIGADFGNVRIEWIPSPRSSLVVTYTLAGIAGALGLWTLAVYISRVRRATVTVRATAPSKAIVPPTLAPTLRTILRWNRKVEDIKIECTNSLCLQRVIVSVEHLGQFVTCPTCGTEIPVARGIRSPRRRFRPQGNGKVITIQISPRLVPVLRRALTVMVPGLALSAMTYGVSRSYNEPAHFSELLKEISSVGEIRKAPVSGNNSKVVWYAKNLEKGIGIFQINTADLSERKLFHLDVDAYEALHLHLHGCSPDSQFFLFSNKHSLAKPLQTLTLASAITGEPLGRIPVRGPTPDVVWLSNDSYAVFDARGDISLVKVSSEQSKNGKPVQTRNVIRKSLKKDASTPIVVTATNAFSYVKSGAIYDFNSDNLTATLKGHLMPGASVISMKYSREINSYLLTATTSMVANARAQLFCGTVGNSNLLSWIPVGPTNEHVYNGQWLLNGRCMAYVVNRARGSQLIIEDSRQEYSTNLFDGGHVRLFRADPTGEAVHAVASLGMEPERVWEYNLRSGVHRSLTVPEESRFKYAKVAQTLKADVPSPAGGVVPYYMLPPVNFKPQDKYPVVIDGPTERRWSSHGQLLANIGVYYVSVSRSGLKSSEELSGAARDILTVYREIGKHPNIDANKIFIMGFSAAGDTVRQLVEAHPEHWQGAVFNNYFQSMKFPAQGGRYPRLLYSIGGLEPRAVECAEFAHQACERSLEVTTCFHPGGGHVFGSTALILERNKLLARFVLRDYWF